MVVFNTCAVRENADNKLYGNLGHLAPVKAATPGMQIAVGGCLAQKDRATITAARRRGSTSSSAPTTSARCRCCSSGRGSRRRRRSRSSSRSRSSPRRCRPGASRRTPPGSRSRSAATTPARSASSRRCAARRRTAGPARSSPRSRRWSPRASARSPCSARTSTPTASSSATGRPSPSCCARAATIEGLERVRFTSPHPAEFTDDVIEAMAETPNVMPQLHMPLQSGSDRVLKAMRRSYRQRSSSASSSGSAPRCRTPRSPPTSSSASPARPRRTSRQTLDVVREARFAGAFTFQYSKRPGTPAADLPDQIAARRGQGPLRAAGRAGQRGRLGGEQEPGRPRASS